MGDLVWVRIFFPKPLVLEIFSLAYNCIRFFQHYVRNERCIFHCRILFFPSISLARGAFSPQTQSITPSKVKWLAPKIHQTFAQLTDSDFKAF